MNPHLVRFPRQPVTPCRPSGPRTARMTRAMVDTPDPTYRPSPDLAAGAAGIRKGGGQQTDPGDHLWRKGRGGISGRSGDRRCAPRKRVGDLPEGQRHLVKAPLEGRTQAIARIDRRDTRFDSLPKWGIGISKAITVGFGGMVPAAVRITTGTGGGPASAFGVVRRISRSGPASCEARNGFPGRQPKQPGRIPCRPIPPPDVSHHAFGDLPQPESVHGFG